MYGELFFLALVHHLVCGQYVYVAPGQASAGQWGGGVPQGRGFVRNGPPAPYPTAYNIPKPPKVHSLVFEYGNVSPDNYVQQGILINQRFPGPPIRCQWFDTLIIDVTNKLDHGISLNFHGLRSYGESYSDGTPYITQEPIPPGGIFRYVLNIGWQTGTYMYHLQSSVADQIWAMGPLIIEDGPELLANHPEYYHFWDHVVILSQCWHIPISDMLKLEGKQGHGEIPFFKGFPSEVASILINGHSFGKWEDSNALVSDGYERFVVKPGKIYRFRVLGAGVDSMLTFSIDGHKMIIIEADGQITNPIEVSRLEVNSGQRYSVLVRMDQAVDNYYIKSEMIPGPGPKNGKAILQYEGAKDNMKMKKKVFSGKTKPERVQRWEGSKLAPNPDIRQPDVYPLPKSVNREIIITTKMKAKKDSGHQENDKNREKRETKTEEEEQSSSSTQSPDVEESKKSQPFTFEINNKPFKTGKVPFLIQVRTNGVNITKERQVYEALSNQSLQIVFQNTASEAGLCEQHAWHVHGHSFYVVGHGEGKYDPEKNGEKIDNKVEADSPFAFRDVVTIYPEPEGDKDQLKPGEECGWSAIRMLTDNPGVWLSHCHLATHLAAGEEFVIYSHTKDDPMLRPVPPAIG